MAYGLEPLLRTPVALSAPAQAQPVAVRPVSASLWVVLDVTLPSCDAWRARGALVRWPGCGLLRCVPLLHIHRVRLEIRLRSTQVQAVIDGLMAALPRGEIGPVCSWRAHMRRHGLSHGG